MLLWFPYCEVHKNLHVGKFIIYTQNTSCSQLGTSVISSTITANFFHATVATILRITVSAIIFAATHLVCLGLVKRSCDLFIQISSVQIWNLICSKFHGLNEVAINFSTILNNNHLDSDLLMVTPGELEIELWKEWHTKRFDF